MLASLGLEDHGLSWCRAPLVLAHPLRDGRCAALSQDLEESAASLEQFAPGDGAAWRGLQAWWQQVGEDLVAALMAPFPPVTATARLGRRLGPRGMLDLVRFGLCPFSAQGPNASAARAVLAGNALHSDLTPGSPGGALFGWLLGALGQSVGFPLPQGGAGQLTAALVSRLTAAGGRLVCGERAQRIVVRGHRARSVLTEAGGEWRARRAVLADVGAPALYRELLEPGDVPARVLSDIDRFQYDSATFKVDWALDGPIPWSAPAARRAATLHVGEGMDALSAQTALIDRQLIPDQPFLVMGQYAAADPTRQPVGRETAWAYTHLPQRIRGDAGSDGLRGRWDDG